MYKRKSKPDLLFMMTVFVCLGVLLTATVNAAEKDSWGINLSAESGCTQAIGEWQSCSKWQRSESDKPAPYRAALRLSSEDRPDLGLIWYYTHADKVPNTEDRQDLSDNNLANFAGERRQFGVVVKQQYRHFGFSMGIEAKHLGDLTEEPLLYFGVNNNW